MDFNTYRFPGNAVLRVIDTDVILECGVGNEEWFESDGALHRFSKQEFALMTRLKFSLMKIDITKLKRTPLIEDDIIGKFFPKVKNMKLCGLL